MFLVTALAAEAKPVIDSFKLSKQTGKTPFPLYTNDNLKLIVSGVGKVKAAMAVSWLYAQVNDDFPACLNVGIAGHADEDLGKCFRVNKIIDADDDSVVFPSPVARLNVSGKTVKTVSKPGLDYKDNDLLDMEASGFFSAATKFVSAERIALLKIVSDNKETPAHNITAQLVEELIADNFNHVDNAVRALHELDNVVHESSQTSELRRYYERQHRLTITQSRQVTSLLDDCLSRNITADNLHEIKAITAKELVRTLKNLRDAAPVF